MLTTVEWSDVKALSFDCYGTLIDWEQGLLGSLMPLLRSHGVEIPEADALDLYAHLELEAEQGSFRDYKSVLRAVLGGFASRFRFQLQASECDLLISSLKQWAPFPDTVEALTALKQNFKLVVISNVDDDLFSFTQRRLGVQFDWVITAEQVKSYKPSQNNFRRALKQTGFPMDKIVHVAQSSYHDIVPATRMGLSCVWVKRNRRLFWHDSNEPHPVCPIVVPDLLTLVDLIARRR